MDFEAHQERVAGLTASYLGNHHVPPEQIGNILQIMHNELLRLAANGATAIPAATVSDPEPAFGRDFKTPSQIRNSVRPEGIISFLDGKSYKTLKRHLTTHGLTPQQYRERFGLPADYPVTCANYAEQRSNLAKSIGLGSLRKKAQPAEIDGASHHATEVRQSHED